jgi:hypothetical protein
VHQIRLSAAILKFISVFAKASPGQAARAMAFHPAKKGGGVIKMKISSIRIRIFTVGLGYTLRWKC